MTFAGRGSPISSTISGALAHDPKTLGRTWESVKQVMAPGALEPKVKEMLYDAFLVDQGGGQDF